MLGLLLCTGEWREWEVLNREEAEVGGGEVEMGFPMRRPLGDGLDLDVEEGWGMLKGWGRGGEGDEGREIVCTSCGRWVLFAWTTLCGLDGLCFWGGWAQGRYDVSVALLSGLCRQSRHASSLAFDCPCMTMLIVTCAWFNDLQRFWI